MKNKTKYDDLILYLKNKSIVVYAFILILVMSGVSTVGDNIYKIYGYFDKVSDLFNISSESDKNLTFEAILKKSFIKYLEIEGQSEYLTLLKVNNIACISYLDEKYTVHTGIFLYKEKENNRIFHGEGSYTCKKILHNNKEYLFVYGISGSLSFLSGTIFSWDPVYLLKNELEITFIQGSVKVINKNLYLSSSGKVYIIKTYKNKLILKEYDENIKYPDFGSSKHILKVKIEPSEVLNLNYDNKNIYSRRDYEDPFNPKFRSTITIKNHEEIIIIPESASYEGYEGYDIKVGESITVPHTDPHSVW